ncbi:unnamed protein product [Cyprideis torosa]|uniref:glucose-6-phosphatase n=1 Tax=Cyprideis torosa TaxID=163714 RepID=A0A7R8WJU2_9CRUS|nr:unnamed protein product [Cyprideis torosa]CAG0896118.1 unnamed protein product [Cyprideis torosa]
MALHHVADGLYLASIPIIALLQTWFEPWAGILVYASHLGDPRTAAFFLFPIAYGLSAHLGLKVLWAATLSEWTNLILKWCLMGHRPYWWVGETTLAHDLPPLDQYSVTCETGPGSPSGHLMTTAAVWYVIITDIVSVILPKIPDDR